MEKDYLINWNATMGTNLEEMGVMLNAKLRKDLNVKEDHQIFALMPLL